MCNDDFSRVFDRYKTLVFSIAYNYCKNVADANDITQETFIKYLKHKRKFESDEHIKAWLIKVKYESEIIITFPTNESIQDVHDATAVWHRFDNDIVYEPLPDMEIEGEWPVFEGDLEVHAFYEGKITNSLEAQEAKKRYVKTVKDPSIYNEGEVKLFVNGVELKRKMNNSYRWASAMDSEDNPTLWGNLIVFDPIDLLEAETIEIRYKDQVIKVK